jgi:hypothetical protein
MTVAQSVWPSATNSHTSYFGVAVHIGACRYWRGVSDAGMEVDSNVPQTIRHPNKVLGGGLLCESNLSHECDMKLLQGSIIVFLLSEK